MLNQANSNLNSSHYQTKLSTVSKSSYWADSGVWDYTLALTLDRSVRLLFVSSTALFGLSGVIESAATHINGYSYYAASVARGLDDVISVSPVLFLVLALTIGSFSMLLFVIIL